MKHKKILAAVLGTACVALLAGSIFFGRSPEPTFTPQAPEETTSQTSWEDASSSTPVEPPSLPSQEEAGLQLIGSKEDLTQTTIADTPEEVIAELTPSVSKEQIQQDTRPTAPPAASERQDKFPDCTADENDLIPVTPEPDEPETAPVSSEPLLPAPAPESTAAPVQTAPAANTQSGQVYDPVFGWMSPAPAQGQAIDNDGDVNKQIGSMN